MLLIWVNEINPYLCVNLLMRDSQMAWIALAFFHSDKSRCRKHLITNSYLFWVMAPTPVLPLPWLSVSPTFMYLSACHLTHGPPYTHASPQHLFTYIHSHFFTSVKWIHKSVSAHICPFAHFIDASQKFRYPNPQLCFLWFRKIHGPRNCQ